VFKSEPRISRTKMSRLISKRLMPIVEPFSNSLSNRRDALKALCKYEAQSDSFSIPYRFKETPQEPKDSKRYIFPLKATAMAT
jgi:hypothetical protein